MKLHTRVKHLIPRCFAALTAAAVFAFCFAALPGGAYAYNGLPILVRIGLYYGSGGAANQAAPSYNVYCVNGISMGFADAYDNYTYLYDFATASKSSQMTISKHYFGKKNAVITGGNSNSLADVVARVDGLRKGGYNPQLAYIGGWALIVGVYDSPGDADQAAAADLPREFPDFGFKRVDLTGGYIMVTVGGERQFIFDAGSGKLRAIPKMSASDGGPPIVELNDKQYRGAIEFTVNDNDSLNAINFILTDEYLYGVVPREIEAEAPTEALIAQAVAARTFTFNSMGKHSGGGFDLCPTTHCQAYGGYAWENPRTSKAVTDSAGKIVMYNGSSAQVFYFASSGGHTENIKNVWGNEYPYLTGVEDKYESGGSQNYDWEKVFTAAEIKNRLAQNNVRIGDITGVAVTKTSEGGRAIEVTVTGSDGTKVYTGDSCRTFLSGLNSQMYTIYAVGANGSAGAGGGGSYAAVGAGGTKSIATGGGEAVGADGGAAKIKGDGGTVVSESGMSGLDARGATFYFVGRGWGHGVGMSQEGAKGMAAAGFTYDEILSHYFPGCTIG